MFGFVQEVRKQAPQATPANPGFLSTFWSWTANAFFAKGPTNIGITGDGTGLTQGTGSQGNYEFPIGGSMQALQISTVWACVRLLSELVGSLPLSIYQGRGDGGRNELRDHPLYDLLHNAPNPLQTRVEWLEQQMLNMLIDGNCYDKITRAGQRIIALYPLAANQTDVALSSNGLVQYSYTPDGGRPMTLTRDEVMQTRLFSNGLKGLSPLGYARATLANARQLQENSINFAAKGNKPSGVLMVDHALKKEQREAVRENFKDIEQNNERLFVLEAGMKYQQLTITPEEAQMMEQRKFSVEDIARIYRVPAYMLNDSEKATTWGSGLEQMNLAFLTYTLRPYLTRFEQVWNNRLLTQAEREAGVYIEFNLDALLRADSKGRAEFYSSMVQNGLMTRNEVRNKENLPKNASANADELTVQSNMLTLDKIGADAPQ
jgi:HK97 family phage portal protein